MIGNLRNYEKINPENWVKPDWKRVHKGTLYTLVNKPLTSRRKDKSEKVPTFYIPEYWDYRVKNDPGWRGPPKLPNQVIHNPILGSVLVDRTGLDRVHRVTLNPKYLPELEKGSPWPTSSKGDEPIIAIDIPKLSRSPNLNVRLDQRKIFRDMAEANLPLGVDRPKVFPKTRDTYQVGKDGLPILKYGLSAEDMIKKVIATESPVEGLPKTDRWLNPSKYRPSTGGAFDLEDLLPKSAIDFELQSSKVSEVETVNCTMCNGTGKSDLDPDWDCFTCEGKGTFQSDGSSSVSKKKDKFPFDF
jgi:hypothetical protein